MTFVFIFDKELDTLNSIFIYDVLHRLSHELQAVRPVARGGRWRTVSEDLDPADADIIAALQSDGRAELLDIAAETGLPGTTVRDRLAALEERGVVRGHTVRIDYERAGYTCPVVIRLRSADDAVDEVTDRLRECPRIHSVYELTGEWNLFAVGRFSSREEFDAYSSRLVTDPAIAAVDADVVTETVKENVPIPPRVPVLPRD